MSRVLWAKHFTPEVRFTSSRSYNPSNLSFVFSLPAFLLLLPSAYFRVKRFVPYHLLLRLQGEAIITTASANRFCFSQSHFVLALSGVNVLNPYCDFGSISFSPSFPRLKLLRNLNWTSDSHFLPGKGPHAVTATSISEAKWLQGQRKETKNLI